MWPLPVVTSKLATAHGAESGGAGGVGRGLGVGVSLGLGVTVGVGVGPASVLLRMVPP